MVQNQGKVTALASFRILILFLGMVLALLAAYKFRNNAPYGDGVHYEALARSLLLKRSYYYENPGEVKDHTILYRAPGYPAFIALIYLITGPRVYAIYYAQAVLFVVTLLIIYKIGYLLTSNEKTAFLSIALCLFWSPFYVAIGKVYPEILWGFLISVFLFCSIKLLQKTSLFLILVSALTLGFAALTKSTIFTYILILPGLILLYSKRMKKQLFFPALLITLVALLTISPWTYRNYKLTGKLIPVNTGLGLNLWIGNNPDFYEKPWNWKDYPQDLRDNLKGKGEVGRDEIFLNYAFMVMKSNPLKTLELFARKFSILWLGSFGAKHSYLKEDPPELGYFHVYDFGIPYKSIIQIATFILAIIGWKSLPPLSKTYALPVVSLILYMTLIHVVITAEMRYVVPLEFYKLMFNAVAINKFIEMLKGKLAKSEHG